MMKILHIVEDFSIQSGGLRTVIKDLNANLNQNDLFSKILSSKKEIEDDIFIVKTKNPWLYSKEWKIKIKKLQDTYSFDLFHIHGVWTYPQFFSAKYCIKNKIPFIVSAHGMYEPWLWKKGTLKKNFYFFLLSKDVFKKAHSIHAITPSENKNLKKLFKNNTIKEIPNLISLPPSSTALKTNNEKYLLYLGRLDKKKGIDILLRSFSKLNNKKITLKIAGQINDYKNELDILIENLKIRERVSFLGLVKGPQKQELIQNAFVMVAPSHSEVIGMVNLEGAILKTPVITTYQTGLNPLWSGNGGQLINPNEIELDSVLNDVLQWTNDERNENGKKLYDFVIENYSWQRRFSDWQELYKSCINEK